MNFDFNRYKRRRFHKDDEIDKKIKALFLYYDYQVADKQLDLAQKLTLLDGWIQKFERHELYEVIPMFKMRRAVVVKQIIRNNNEKMTPMEHIAPNLNKNIGKVIFFFKNLFKRK
jgi:hypothetical protein